MSNTTERSSGTETSHRINHILMLLSMLSSGHVSKPNHIHCSLARSLLVRKLALISFVASTSFEESTGIFGSLTTSWSLFLYLGSLFFSSMQELAVVTVGTFTCLFEAIAQLTSALWAFARQMIQTTCLVVLLLWNREIKIRIASLAVQIEIS